MSKRTSAESSLSPQIQAYFALVDQLPFAGKDPKTGHHKWWTVPQTGGYTGRCKTGGPAAKSFMRFLRDDPGEIRGVLWEIVKSMLGKKECSDALTGQAISFFNTLESTLKLAAQLDGALEMWTYHHCGELIQEGLKFDEQGWIDSMERERRSKASYLGHQRRAKKAQAKGKRKAGRRA